jgi:glycosyltransferase involved in cell wall biosynthesis
MVDLDSEKWAELAENSHWPMSWIYRRETRTLRAFERQAMARAVVTTVVSERERVLVERLLGQPAKTVPVGVDVDFWRRRSDTVSFPEIVFCAVFNYEPNEQGAIWLASQVWPLVRQQVPGARLKLVGMSPTRRVRALAIDGSIEVTGAVADVRPHLWRASAAVAPLWVARGTQTKVLEALAAGVPCIVTPAVEAGLPMDARSACYCRPDPAGFAEALVSCLRDPVTPAKRLEICQSVKNLRWDVQLAPFLGILDGVVAESRIFKG